MNKSFYKYDSNKNKKNFHFNLSKIEGKRFKLNRSIEWPFSDHWIITNSKEMIRSLLRVGFFRDIFYQEFSYDDKK
jgi:hypothetical protein